MPSSCLVVNQYNKPTGAKYRADRLPTDHFRFVQVMAKTPDGRFIVQRRRHTAQTFPGCLDASAGGFVHADATDEQTALVELSEELGITGYAVRHVCSFFDVFPDGSLRDFGEMFELEQPFVGEVSFVVGKELDEVLYLTSEELLHIMETAPESCTSGFIRGFKAYCGL